MPYLLRADVAAALAIVEEELKDVAIAPADRAAILNGIRRKLERLRVADRKAPISPRRESYSPTEEGRCTADELSIVYDVPVVSLIGVTPPRSVVDMIRRQAAEKECCIPLQTGERGGRKFIEIAYRNPGRSSYVVPQSCERHEIVAVAADPTEIRAAIGRAYQYPSKKTLNAQGLFRARWTTSAGGTGLLQKY